MNDSRTYELVAAQSAAADRYYRLDRGWPMARIAMWLIAGAAAVLFIAGVPFLASMLPTFVALTVDAVHALRATRARAAETRAWRALAEHTGLGDEDLARLINDVEAEIGGAE